MFMRKYIHLAKGLKPKLTKEAADMIAEEYTKLRNQDNLENDHMARVSGHHLVVSLNDQLTSLTEALWI